MNKTVSLLRRLAERSADGRVEVAEREHGSWICHLYVGSHCVAIEFDGSSYGAEELPEDPGTILRNGYENIFQNEQLVIEWLKNWTETRGV